MVFIPLCSLALALASLLAVAVSAYAQPSSVSCPALTPTFRNVVLTPVYEHGLNLLEIESLANNVGQHSGPHQSVTGLYLAKILAQSETQVQAYRDGPYVVACFTEFRANLTLESKVHVASEFPSGSCAEQAISDHEYTHHKIQTSSQNAAVTSFLTKNPLPSIPFRGTDEASARAAANQWTNAYLQTLIQSAGQFARPLQQQFDSPSEYQRVSALCPAEFQRVFAGRINR